MSFPELEWLGSAFVPLMIGVVVRSGILALVCGALDYLLRKRPAEIRHAIWHGMLVALLIFPLLLVLVPPLKHSSPALAKAEFAISPDVPRAPASVTVRPPYGITVVASPARAFPWRLFSLAAYTGIALALAIRLSFSLRQLKAVVARSEPVTDINLRELAHESWLQSGAFIKPYVRISREIAVPVALESDTNVFILLPESWQTWPAGKLRLVLSHEMAHVKRNDPSTMLLASVAGCLYWFHPLSWFIKRRLTALSEYACDEQALARAGNAQQYVNALTDFAQEVTVYRGRVLNPASAVVHRSELENRIRRIFKASEIRRNALNLLRCALLAALIPAIYLAAAARPYPQDAQAHWSVPSSDEEAAKMESQLATNPNDMNLHQGLLIYYMNKREEANYFPHALWMVQNHPESFMAFFSMMGAEDYSRLTAAWEQALKQHPDSPDVLFNAATFFQLSDPERSLNLLQRAQQLDRASAKSERYETMIAHIYAEAVAAALHVPMMKFNPDFAAKLQLELEASSDPSLLSKAGTQLVVFAALRHDEPVLRDEGYRLLQRAIDLDPTNPKWKEALETAKYESVRQQNYRAMSPPNGSSNAQRIGAAVMAANLITKVDPVYPPLALSARVQGTVDFTVTVGPDGHVENLQLVRGHPLLVQAAKDAVLQWVYRPTLLNGQPVTVVTEVSVPFRLP
jgi:TonB family protein